MKAYMMITHDLCKRHAKATGLERYSATEEKSHGNFSK